MRGLCILLAAGACLAVPTSATAEPKILRAGLEQSALLGSGLTFAVEASDPHQGVTSLAVRLPDQAGVFAESACRVDRKGRQRSPRGLGAGRRGRFAFPFTPVTTGEQEVDVTVTSGACGLTPRQTHKTVKVKVNLSDLPALPAPPKVTGPKGIAAQILCPGFDLVPERANMRAVRSAILCMLNLQRAAKKLPLLHSSRRLRRAARRHAADMLRRGYFDHQGPGGPTLPTRLRRVGYWPASAAENLGLGAGPLSTPVNMVLAWMDSDSHRENILERKYSDLGIGVVRAGTQVAYTTDFGVR
jgi:uncharacterized protein YkwD